MTKKTVIKKLIQTFGQPTKQNTKHGRKVRGWIGVPQDTPNILNEMFKFFGQKNSDFQNKPYIWWEVCYGDDISEKTSVWYYPKENMLEAS